MATVHASKETASLADFLQILRLRKALIILILALVVVTALAVTAFLPRCEPVMGDKQSRVMGYTLVVVGGWI